MKLVTAPVPSSLAKRRQTTKNACSTIGSAAARASSAQPRADARAAATRPSRRAAASAASGTASATTPFSSVPQAHATIPSSPTRQRISASPSALPSA